MRAIRYDDQIKIEDGYFHRESIKEIAEHRYDPAEKAWFVPCNEQNIALLQMLGAELDGTLRAFVKPVCDISPANENPITPMPIKATPYKHQVRAFNFIMQIFAEDGKGGDADEIQQGA